MGKGLSFLLLTISSIIVLLFLDTVIEIGEFYFYFLLSYIAIDLLIKKNIGFNHIWSFAFIYMILSEVFSNPDLRNSQLSLTATKYIVTCNNVILMGYVMGDWILSKKKKKMVAESKIQLKPTKFSSIMLLGLVALFCYNQYEYSIMAFTLGRLYTIENYSLGLMDHIINALGFILPAMLAYYYCILKKKSVYIPLFISLPIFILFFLGGTRFFLLFSLLGFVIVYTTVGTKQNNIKNYFILGGAVIALLIMSNVMKSWRNSSSYNIEKSYSDYKSLPEYLSYEHFSSEAAIKELTVLFRHFESREHLYGASSSFLLYFWVPRSVWENKPKMLGRWVVDKYYPELPSTHSITFGFVGDLYADFGYYSVFFVFILGYFLKKIEVFKDVQFGYKNHKLILGAMFYPVIFFSVRDPITSLISFMGIYFFFQLFQKVILKKI